MPEAGRDGGSHHTHLQGENEKPVQKNIGHGSGTHTDKGQRGRTIVADKDGQTVAEKCRNGNGAKPALLYPISHKKVG